MKTRPLCLVLFVSLAAFNSSGADYLGAASVLEQVKASLASGKKPEPGDSAQKISADLAAFRAAAHPSPKEAASQWLALLNRVFAGDPRLFENGSSQALSFANFVKALPGPAAWESLRDAVARENPKDKAGEARQAALLWFIHRLLGDIPALLTDRQKFVKIFAPLRPDSQGALISFLLPMDAAYFQVSDDGDAVIALLSQELEAMHKAQAQSGDGGQGSSLSIPNLAGLAGEKKTAAFLGRALREMTQPITITSGDDMRKLTARIALENVSDLGCAQWRVTQSLEGGDLYAALLARFGPQEGDNEFRTARGYELFRLLLAGKTADAVKLSQTMTADRPGSLPSSALEEMENAGRAETIADFFHELLSQNPNLPYWDLYIEVAVRAGQSDQMMALLNATLGRKDLTPATTASLETHQANALLAIGKADQGVALLAKIARNPTPTGPPSDYTAFGPFEAAERMVRIGRLLQRNDWIDQGLTLARAAIQNAPSQPGRDYQGQENRITLAKLLLDLNRGPEAEKVLLDALIEASTPANPNHPSYADNRAELLRALVGLYTAAGRSADVLALLKDAPGWSATDLSQILTNDCYVGNRQSDPLGVCAALALVRTGQGEKARPIVETLFRQDSADDRVYELLLELDKAGAISILDRIYASDPFEERPLIWKAKLLLDAGKLDEAEKVAREAIKVDPSDGEEGPGDRMRVYSVLADILEAKGNAADAKTFRGVVAAIRLSENADQYYEVGLISQAVDLYQQSLGYFSDAYCIQSRLALRLTELGDWKQAEEHYRRAYELMPESFGRVESHCFGCERAFAGDRQQSIAEKVFTEIAAQHPDNPQVYYLLGYLRFEQDRFKDALPEFQRAVALDPEYLNAWKKIDEVGEQIHLPASLRESVATNLLRLDPAGKHASASLGGVADLGQIWKLLAQQKSSPASSKNLYPLPASTAALTALVTRKDQNISLDDILSAYRPSETSGDPGEVFSQQDFSNTAGNLLQMSYYLNNVFQ